MTGARGDRRPPAGVRQPGHRRGGSVNGPNGRRVAAFAAVAVTPLVAVQLVAAPVLALVGAVGGRSAGVSVSAAPVGVRTGTAQVAGSGFGHGVGMSQYGALGMAKAGASARQILQHYYSGVTVTGFPDNRDVRVNVVHSARTITFGATSRAANGGVWRLLAAGRAPQTLGVDDSATLTVAAGSVSVVVRHGPASLPAWTTPTLTVRWAGTRALPGDATTLDVLSRRVGSTSTKQRSYRWGAVQVTSVAGALEAVAVVGLHEEYLRGVAEVPSSWPAAALQAQVVAARNYALTATSTPRASCGGCQLWDDQRSQVYVGWAKESEPGGSPSFGQRWVAAVRATALSSSTGLTVLYQGAPITAYFASSTGGRTRNVQDVWGGGAQPYLRSVADPYSLDSSLTSFAHWTRPVSVAGLRSVFGLPDLVSVRVTARDSGGAAGRLTATSASGATASVTGERFRSAFALPGAWVGSVALPAPPAPPAPPPAPTPSGSASGAGVGTTGVGSTGVGSTTSAAA
jgi:stage II sporulation protein D